MNAEIKSRSGRITISEIAKQAGVSKQTVSRVLNNRPDVSPQTRNRIQKIIDSSNYQPSQLARNLARGRTNTIGVISSDFRYVGPSHKFLGIDEQAYALGYTLSLKLLHEQEDNAVVDTILQNMIGRRVDGIIWSAVSKLDNYDYIIDKLINLPTLVVIGSELRPKGLSAIDTDNYEGAAMATQHLIDRGYKKIAIITGFIDDWSAKQRLEGWQQTSRAFDPMLVYEGDWTAESGYIGLQKLLQQRPDIDAVFSSNDQMALGVLKAARECGRQVPQDLGVVGYDDIPEAAFFTPSLTTVNPNLVENGRRLVIELDRQIQARINNEPCEPRVIKTATKLIIRSSSKMNH